MKTLKRFPKELEIDISLLGRTKLFSTTMNNDIQLIASCCKERIFRKKATVFEKGDPGNGLYIIKHGMVEVISISSEGKEIIFNVMGEGASFGEISLLDNLPRSATIRALTDCALLFVSAVDFSKISSEFSKDFWKTLTYTLCGLLRQKTEYIEDFHFLNSKQRISKKILDLFQKQGSGSVKLSQEKLANMVGLTREMTNKSLSYLEAVGAIQIKHSTIDVLNVDKLGKESLKCG